MHECHVILKRCCCQQENPPFCIIFCVFVASLEYELLLFPHMNIFLLQRSRLQVFSPLNLSPDVQANRYPTLPHEISKRPLYKKIRIILHMWRRVYCGISSHISLICRQEKNADSSVFKKTERLRHLLLCHSTQEV